MLTHFNLINKNNKKLYRFINYKSYPVAGAHTLKIIFFLSLLIVFDWYIMTVCVFSLRNYFTGDPWKKNYLEWAIFLIDDNNIITYVLSTVTVVVKIIYLLVSSFDMHHHYY